ncbi:MAG: hypothetical protein ACYCW6_03570 [Candidatus Xenobia bacterium]
MQTVSTGFLERFELGDLLVQCRFSTLHRARDRSTGEPVVIRSLQVPADEELRRVVHQQFLREGEVLRRLAHRNLPHVMEVLQEERGLQAVLEPFDGHSIDYVVKHLPGLPGERLLLRWMDLNFRRSAERPRAMMAMEEGTFGVLSRLTRDLGETNLQSIRTASGTLVMESPRDDQDHLCMSPFGTVQWKKYAYYQLQPDGHLTCDDSANGVTVEPAGPPSMTTAKSRHYRVLANHVSEFKVFWTDAHGNPQDFGDAATARGEPVVVQLTLTDVSQSTGKATVRHVGVQVKPQN